MYTQSAGELNGAGSSLRSSRLSSGLFLDVVLVEDLNLQNPKLSSESSQGFSDIPTVGLGTVI